MNIILFILAPICHGFVNFPLKKILLTHGVISGIRQSMYNELSIQSNIIGITMQLQDTHYSNPCIINGVTSLLIWGLLTKNIRKYNNKVRHWKHFTYTERATKIFILAFLVITTKNVDYAF